MAIVVVQLLAFWQGADILDLLKFPKRVSGEVGQEIRCELMNFEGVRRRRLSSIAQVRNLALKQPTCELLLRRSNQIIQRLVISPTSQIWHGKSGLAPIPENISRDALGFISYETSVRFNEIEVFPSILIVEYNFASGEMPTVDAMDLVVESFPEEFLEKGLSGAVDLVSGRPRFNILNSMAPWIRGVDRLAETPDELHDVIIAPGRVCRGISEALKDGQIRYLTPSREGLALLGLSPETVRRPESLQIAATWLVPRDASTQARRIGQSPGEIRIGSGVYLTVQRRAELEQKRCLVPVGKEFEMSAWPLVDEKYCLMLGIDPGSMLTASFYNRVALSVRGMIDQRFAQLADLTPVVDRVWQSHREAFIAHDVLDQEVLSYLGSHYFARKKAD